MKQYNFDKIASRKGTWCVKHDMVRDVFGTDDLLPMWVADMDFKTPDFILNAIRSRCDHEVLGYTFAPDSYNPLCKDPCLPRYKRPVLHGMRSS